MRQRDLIWIGLLLELILIEITTGWYHTMWILMAIISITCYFLLIIAQLLGGGEE